ncbi:endonuclease/exonuclease/phosphatase family protein [Gangjinia marincola]|uniref:Endonuclease/exonuclease/phosphatase family protein n=1 Tax=Gangjinia marincola TaxID=578463 RepID=A0ABN1MJC8_9FLAO
MKKLSFIDKIIFFLNSLFAAALLLAYLLPFIPPTTFPALAILSLGVPFLIIINIFFLLFWAIRFKKQLLLSLIVLLFGLNHLTSLYQYAEEESQTADSISVMSFNVRNFNRYEWMKTVNVSNRIAAFIAAESPDILCVQEYYDQGNERFKDFSYAYIEPRLKEGKTGQAIFSKYPIVSKGSLDFEGSMNNAIYADVVIKKDTLRIFNVHLESLKINPRVSDLQQEEQRDILLTRMSNAFKLQQGQTKKLTSALEAVSHRKVVCVDLNNTAYSYVYRQLSNTGLKDAFKEAGTGLGRTFNFDFIPLRIDMIFVDEEISISGFSNYDIELSDHFPVSTRIRL